MWWNCMFYAVISYFYNHQIRMFFKNRGRWWAYEKKSVKNQSSSIYDYNRNNHDEWFLIEYNGTYGYVNTNYISLTENQTQLPEIQLIEIARSRHMEGSWILAYEFSKLIEIDFNAGYRIYW